MRVELKHNTPLHICSDAIRKCRASQKHSDKILGCRECGCTENNDEGCIDCGADLNTDSSVMMFAGTKDKELIHKIGNKMKHSSTLEHLVYHFDISGVSRALLQEFARHRIAGITVKSSRYTLKEIKVYDFSSDLEDDWEKFLVKTNDCAVNAMSIKALSNLYHILKMGTSNDIAKYCMPESYKTELSWTINARSLQNFLELRTVKDALWEIRKLAYEIFNQLPEDHKYLFTECLYKEDKTIDDSIDNY